MADKSSPAQQGPPTTPALARAQLTVSGGTPGLAAIAVVIGVLFLAAIVLVVYLVHPPTTRLSFGALADRAWQVVAFSAAIGLASSAILQVAKQVFGLRSIWQQRWVRTWVRRRCAVQQRWKAWLQAHGELTTTLPDAPGLPPDLAIVDAIVLEQEAAAWEQLQTALLGAYADRDLRLVFDLPAEQLCALLATSADSALASPHSNAELLLAFSGPTGLDDIDLVAPPRAITAVKRDTDEIGYQIDRSADSKQSPGDSEKTSTAQAKPGLPGDDAALGRLAQSVRSGLDVLQASMTQQWSRAVRTWAVAISGVLGTVIVLFIRLSSLDRLLFAASALLLGGFFAWLFRDLTAVVERVRR